MTKAVRVFWKIILVIAILAMAAAIILATVSGFFLPPQYLNPWGKDYHMQYTDKRLKVAAHGLLAPNAFNMQLWQLRLDTEDESAFYLYADAQKNLQDDSDYHDLMMCQGTFVEFCVTAAQQLGYDAEVQLFPDGEIDEQDFAESARQKPICKIALIRAEQDADAEHSIIYNQMFLPHTNRQPYVIEKPVTAAQKALVLQAAEQGAPAGLSFSVHTDSAVLSKIRQLATEGKDIEQHTPRLTEEFGQIFLPNEYIKNQKRYGISLEAMSASGVKLQLLQGLVTLMPFLNSGENAAQRQIEGAKKALEATPAFVAIKGTANTRAEQVEMGRAFARLMLAAKANGLAINPLSQLTAPYPEAEQVRQQATQLLCAEGEVLGLVARLGVPQKAAVHSPRQDLNSLFVK